MEKKYINSSRYKSSSSELKKNRRKENISKKIKNGNTLKTELNVSYKNTKKINRKKKRKNNKVFIIFFIILIIISMVIIRMVSKEPDESFFDIFKTKIEEESLDRLDFGIVDNVDILDLNTKNIVLTELNGYISGNLLNIDTEYNIQYDLLEGIEKVSNKEYILNISKDNALTSDILKSKLNAYKSSDSKYYLKVKNIESMEVIDSKKLKFSLYEEDALFIYDLQLPINYTSLTSGIYSQNTVKNNQNMLNYMIKEGVKLDIPKTINLYKIENDIVASQMFKDGTINMFVTNSYSVSEVLGNAEFNFSSYRNGECLFLFGNKNSDLFSRQEVRQAIAYSIDRDRIIREVYLNSGELIDLPFIYSEVKYKYDIYGAQNLLLTKGYTLTNNVFSKIENGKTIKVSLNLLVNKSDEKKLKVAELIKENLANVGIEIKIQKLSVSDITKNIQKGNYDLVLADLNINESPDISFIYNHININDNINQVIQNIQNETNINNLKSHINELKQVMSDEIACVGIHASTTYLVYTKGINVFDNISYMNIFSKLLH